MAATPKIPTVTELPPWRSTTLLSFLVCCDCLLCVASSERHEPQRQPLGDSDNAGSDDSDGGGN